MTDQQHHFRAPWGLRILSHVNKHVIAESQSTCLTRFRQKLFKKWRQMKSSNRKMSEVRLTQLLLFVKKRRSPVWRAGIFFSFPLKHDKQDQNNIKLHKVQAYNILIVITVNTRECGGWYYSETRREYRNGSLSQTNETWRRQRPAASASLQVLGKLECNIFRKTAKEQAGLKIIWLLLHLIFIIFHYTFYRLTKYWTNTSVPKHHLYTHSNYVNK